MRGIQRPHAAAARWSTAKRVETEAGDAGAGLAAAHQAPHTRCEWAAEMALLRLEVAEALRRWAEVVVEECEWLRVDWRRWAVVGVRLKACEVCAMQLEVEGEVEQDHRALYSWSP